MQMMTQSNVVPPIAAHVTSHAGARAKHFGVVAQRPGGRGVREAWRLRPLPVGSGRVRP
ncbi:protein of unknown function [Streptomyces sp. KY75]|nr:protein of unknown function [Streptomyces sp. KY70]CAD5973779.1 protein of unknown function [Streptomyces sp. KY75]